MSKVDTAPKSVIAISVFMAVMATLMPLPGPLMWWAPCWVLIVITHWQLYTHDSCGIVTAFFIGLWLDLALGTLLGEHSLALVVCSYAVIRFQQPIRLANLFSRTILIFFISLAYCTILLMTSALQGHVHGQWFYWFPAISTALIWPTLSQILFYFGNRKSRLQTNRI
jgi:rod shape-determining protein MreD